jgi:serine protease Do
MKRMLQWPVMAVLLVGGIAAGRWISPVDAQTPTTTTIPKELTSYRDIVKQVLPAVVSIEAKVTVKRTESGRRAIPEIPDGVPEEFRRFFEQGQRRIPINPRSNTGSGFVVDPSGVIMTNYHVVGGAESVEVKFTDGRTFTSTDIKTDRNSDLAIIRIKSDSPLPALRFGQSAQMEVGDRVLAVGAPFGLAGSVTHGIISAMGRDLELNRYDDFIQTDAPINPGNSGGPLVNLAGEVIGVNSAIKSHSGGYEGVSMSISGDMAKSVMQQLLKSGTVKRGYLGIEMALRVNPEVATRLGLKSGGVVVAAVHDNSPAAKAGMRVEDAIVAVDGKPVRENRELQRIVAGLPLNQSVPVSVIRDGQPVTLTLTIEPQPKDFDEARRPLPRSRGTQNVEVISVPAAGIELADLNEERAEALGFTRKEGAIIASVDQNGAAAEAGLSRGVVIVKVDKKTITNAEEAKAALEAADPVKGALVQAVSPLGGTAYVVVKVQK